MMSHAPIVCDVLGFLNHVACYVVDFCIMSHAISHAISHTIFILLQDLRAELSELSPTGG
jgi:hypothetical protein